MGLVSRCAYPHVPACLPFAFPALLWVKGQAWHVLAYWNTGQMTARLQRMIHLHLDSPSELPSSYLWCHFGCMGPKCHLSTTDLNSAVSERTLLFLLCRVSQWSTTGQTTPCCHTC